VEYSGRLHDPIPATRQAYYDLYDHTAKWADGPFYFSIISPSEASKIHYSSRDRTLEAFEDGHPHVIYSSF
jgi:hypothetical protein